MGLLATQPDEGISTTQPLPKGTKIYPKDSERLETLADRDSSNLPVTALSGTDAEYQDIVFEAGEEMDEDIQQPDKEETQSPEPSKEPSTEIPTKDPVSTEHQSPSPNKDVDEMAFGGNTRDLNSIWEETDKNSTPRISISKEHTVAGDGITIYCDGVKSLKLRRQDFSDGVRSSPKKIYGLMAL
ncbi:hypothetical protein Tco_0188889 [Tanacetum coccineum]